MMRKIYFYLFIVQGIKVPNRDLALTWHRVLGLGQLCKVIFFNSLYLFIKSRRINRVHTSI